MAAVVSLAMGTASVGKMDERDEDVAVRRFVIKIDGQVYEVEAEEIGDAPPSAPRPAVQTSVQQPVAAPASARGGSDETVAAPLPGTILEIKVAAGEEVEAGQVLMILEAMKMENEIRAPRPGRVATLAVTKGQAVSAGDPLLHLA